MKNIKVLTPFEFKQIFRNKISKLNETAGPHSYGCIMADIDSTNIPTIEFKKEDLYSPETHGIELEKHCTVLYGLHKECDTDSILDFLKVTKAKDIVLKKLSLFENNDFDVVKWEVESDDLFTLNKICTQIFPYTNSHPEYSAHVTEAYVLPGLGKNYLNKEEPYIVCKITNWIYSLANGEKYIIDLDGNVEQIGFDEGNTQLQ